jgi:hypothetical protein
VTDGVFSRLRFHNRPTVRGDMVETRPRLMTSAANSLGVQGVTGRPERSGASQATAMSWQRCAAVNVAGRPQRGASCNTCGIKPRQVGSSASSAAAARGEAALAQRARHHRTVMSLLPNMAAICRLRAPPALWRMIVARWTSSCGRRRLRTISARMVCCRSVSSIATGSGPRGLRICTPPAPNWGQVASTCHAEWIINPTATFAKLY